MSKRKKKHFSNFGKSGLGHNDPILISKRLKDMNDKALQGNKPDWEDKYEYGLSDW